MDSTLVQPANRRHHAWRWLLAGLMLSTFIGCDQATKYLATRTLKDQPPQAYWADIVRLEYALNPGGFLSLGSTLSPTTRWWIFVGFNVFLTAGLAAYLIRNRQVSVLVFASIILIMAGGIGNLIDRVFNQGLVTDFINVGVGPIRTGIFNVADVAITAGALAVLVLSWLPAKSQLAPQTPQTCLVLSDS